MLSEDEILEYACDYLGKLANATDEEFDEVYEELKNLPEEVQEEIMEHIDTGLSIITWK